MIQVQAPDNSIVEFPDGTPDDVMAKAMREAFGGPQAGASNRAGEIAADVAKSGGVGLAKGALGVAGMVPDISGLLRKGFNAGLDKLGILTNGGATPAPREAFGMNLDKLGTSQQLQEGVQAATGPFYKPKTTAGEYAQTVGEFLPGAIATPGGLAANAVKFGVVPALVSETAGQMTKGTGAEPWARLAGGVVGGGAAALATRPNIETRMVANATRGATEANINQAMQLMSDSATRGIRLTWAEALQQVTNNGTQAGRLQRVIEGTREGGQIMAPAMAERPGQVTGAVNQTLDRIAPQTEPTITAIRGQNAADNAIGNIRRQINAAESPYYAAANARSVPPRDLNFISQDPAFQQAFQNVRNDPIRNKDIANFGANEVPTLIAVRKELARMEQNALSPGMAANPDRELARGITPIRERLDQIITQSAPEYGQALGVGASLREQVLAPAQRGPLGQVAQSESLSGQTGALFPAKPFEGTAGETSRTIGVMNAADPRAAAGLARQHLAQNFAEATQNLQPGPNQFGGAKFAATVAGNPLQRQVLEANLGALPNGQRSLPDVQGLLQTLEATGKRQQPGSLTAFNASDIKDMQGTGLLGSIMAGIRSGNPMNAAKDIKDSIDRARLGSRSSSIASGLLADPGQARALIQMARERSPEGATARGLLSLFITAQPPARGINN